MFHATDLAMLQLKSTMNGREAAPRRWSAEPEMRSRPPVGGQHWWSTAEVSHCWGGGEARSYGRL